MSCRVVSCRVVSRRVVSCRVVSPDVVSRLLMTCSVMSRHFDMSRHVVSHFVRTHHSDSRGSPSHRAHPHQLDSYARALLPSSHSVPLFVGLPTSFPDMSLKLGLYTTQDAYLTAVSLAQQQQQHKPILQVRMPIIRRAAPASSISNSKDESLTLSAAINIAQLGALKED